MKRSTAEQLRVLCGLILLGVGLRLYFQEIPNFAPVAALALFAGFYCESRRLAILAPMGVMLISDAMIGGYQPLLMLANYALLALPVLFRGRLRQQLARDESSALQRRRPAAWAAGLRSSGALAGCTLAASLTFFVGSNLMTWVVTPWYPRTADGLIQCFANAIPFFRYTLAGDLCFAALLFGGYAVARQASGLAWHPAAARVRTSDGGRAEGTSR